MNINKTLGQLASCGAIALYCMNLPLEARFSLENVFIVGTTPIPNMPDVFTISHITQFVVNMVSSFSPPGKSIPTFRYPQGTNVDARIIPVIADLQAIRKFAGFLAHGANMFCWFCLCTQLEIERLDWETWDYRYGITVRKQAEEWRNENWIAWKEARAKETGVRWTPMHNFPYWDPVAHVTLGFMHNWLEGILSHQLRVLWGIGRSEAEKAKLDLLEKEEQFTDTDVSESMDDMSDLELEAKEHSDRASSTGLTEPLNDLAADTDDGEKTPTYAFLNMLVDDNDDNDADYVPDDSDSVFNVLAKIN